MLLPKLELQLLARHLLARLPDGAPRRVRTAVVDAHSLPLHHRLHHRDGTSVVAAAAGGTVGRGEQDLVPDDLELLHEVGPAMVHAFLELDRRHGRLAGDGDRGVAERVRVEVARDVGPTAEQRPARGSGAVHRLPLKRVDELVEPLVVRKVLADPDEVHAAQALGGAPAGRLSHVPDLLEDRRPRRDADAAADDDGRLVLEDVLGRRPVRTVDVDARHLLPGPQHQLRNNQRIGAVAAVFLSSGG